MIENRETTRGRQGSSPGPNPTEFDLLSCDLTLLDPKQPRAYHGDETAEDIGAGLPDFITKEELERRLETLLRDDCLAIRCDVGVTQLGVLTVAPKETHNARPQDDGDDSDWEGGGGESSRRRRRQPLDDMEYIRRSLAKNRRA